MKKISLRLGLIVTFGLLISFPIVISSVINYNHVTKAMGAQVEQNSNLLITEIENEINNYFEIYSSGIQLLSLDDKIATLDINEDNRLALEDVLENFMAIYPDVSQITIGYENHAVITYPSSLLFEKQDINNQLWYTQTKATNHTTLTNSTIDLSNSNLPLFKATISTPIIRSGQLIGVLSLEINLSELAQKLSQVQFGEAGYPVLLTHEGIVVTHKNPELLGKKVIVPELEAFIDQNTSGSFNYVYDSVDKIAFLRTIGDYGWKILVTLPQKELVTDAIIVVNTNLIIGLILLILSLILVCFISKIVDRNISKLVTRVSYLSEGDLSSRYERYFFKEFEVLSEIIEKIIKKISDLIFKAQSTAIAVKYVSFTITNYSISSVEEALIKISDKVQMINENVSKLPLSESTSDWINELKEISDEACSLLAEQKAHTIELSKLSEQLDNVTDHLQSDINQFKI